MTRPRSRMRRAHLASAVSLIALSGAALTGCSSPAAPTPGTDSASGALVQVIMPVSSPAMAALQTGLETRGKELGLDVQVSQSNGDPTKDVANINDAIAKGAKAIVLVPVSTEGAIPALTRATSDGICVLAGGTNHSPENPLVPDVAAYWLWDDTPAATNLTEQVAEKMGGAGGLYYIAGTATDPGSQAREAAIKATLADKYPDIEFLGSDPADYDAAAARTVMQNAVQRFGDKITGVIAAADNMAQSAADVIDASALAGSVTVGGFAGQGSFVDYIKDGRAFATVPYPYSDIGASVMDAAETCISGDTATQVLDPRDLNVLAPLESSGYVLTADNVDEYTPQY